MPDMLAQMREFPHTTCTNGVGGKQNNQMSLVREVDMST